jgi:ATP-dependent DNA ligase
VGQFGLRLISFKLEGGSAAAFTKNGHHHSNRVRRDCGLRVWAFDHLHHNGRDLRELPLVERKARLEKLILAAKCQLAALLGKLRRRPRLLKAADRLGLEGIVSKRRDAPYRSAFSVRTNLLLPVGSVN